MILNLSFYFIVFIFGLVAGSFLNCVIYRLYKKEGFLVGRSYCPKCGHKLAWYDLIPLFSFVALKGKCRYCGQKISWQYPLVEIATGILFVLVLNYELKIANYEIFNLGFILNSLFLILSSCFLIVIFVYDLKHYIIPDKVIYPAIAIAFLYQLFEIWNFGHWGLFGIWNLEFGILKPILSAILASAFFGIIVFISRGKWMGIGDIKLAFLMGLILNFPNILVALFLAFFIGAIIGTGLIIFKKKGFRSEIPFGPFLVTGTFIALFWGDKIINWYLSLIFP